MAWDRPILTDRGGFQVFSLESQRELDDDGVTFRSHLDGSAHRFTPENVVGFQEALGVDVAMVLDECMKLPATPGGGRRFGPPDEARGRGARRPPGGADRRRSSVSCRAASTKARAPEALPN